MGDTGVVYETIEPSPVDAQFVKHLLDVIVPGDVTLDGIGLATLASNLFNRFTSSFGVNLEHIHPCSLFGEGERDRLTNPGASPGHHCVLSFQAEHVRQCPRDCEPWQATSLGQALLTAGEGSITLGQAHE